MSEYSEETRAKLISIRGRLAEASGDDSILEFDIDDPDTALALVIGSALLDKGKVILSAESEDGKTEEISFTRTDEIESPLALDVKISSSDGTLTPETAEFAVDILRPSLHDAINRMTDAEQ